jgi:hypothetical protein
MEPQKTECESENFWLTPLLKSNLIPSNSSGFSDTGTAAT